MIKKNRSHVNQGTANMKINPVLAIVGCGAIAETYYLPALADCPSILSNMIFFLFTKAGKSYRILGWIWLAVFILLVMTKSKIYYLAPAGLLCAEHRG